jgi:3,4-dihydroxyphenylacetate 2,3-dioxygenase
VIDTNWVQPNFDILRISHVELVVTDLARSAEFWCDLMGFVVTEEADDALYIRGLEEQYHHSLVLRRGDEPCLGHFAFRMRSPGDVERIAEHFGDGRWIEDEAGQGPGFRVQDPLGFPVEFFYEMDHADRLLQRYDLYRGCEPLRIDHVNLFVPDLDEAYEQYRQLGFRCSEYIETEDGRLVAAWMLRKPTVHDCAFTVGAGPRLHHFAVTVPDRHAIVRFCDLAAALGKDGLIERGPGRHGISNAFFIYLRDPDGHRLELFTGDYYTGDPDLPPLRWSVTDPHRRTFWGHAVPDAWYEEGTLCASLDGELVDLREPQLDERVVQAE